MHEPRPDLDLSLFLGYLSSYKRVVLQEAYEQGRSIFTYQPDRTKMDAVEELRGLYLRLAQEYLRRRKEAIMADKDDRIAALAKRFQQSQQRNDKEPDGQSGTEPTRRERAHRSFYLDKEIYRRLDSSYKTTAHELYPQDTSKSIFIETCLAYAFDHLEEIKTILRQLGEQGEHK